MAHVPSSLRVGSSPVVGTDPNNPFSDHNATSETTYSPARDRPPSLFPQRPSLVSTRRDSRQRYSYTSSVSSVDSSSFAVPGAPSPPTFSGFATYDSEFHHFTQPGGSSPAPSRQPSLLSKIGGTLGSLRGSRRSRYGKLEDEDEGGNTGYVKAMLRGVQEEDDDEESIGFDVSALEGPIALRNMPMKGQEETKDLADRVAYVGLDDDYHRLEAGDKLGRLGSGMNGVLDASEPIRKATVRRGNTSARAQRAEAQKVADKSGEILAIETPMVDISNLAGAEYETRSVFERTSTGPENRSTTSYYFPPDPDMPSWRPISMRWWYISVLVLIALCLGTIQELLCQESMRQAKHGKGLLEFVKPQDLTMTQYFTWKYAPTIILLSYGILWQISDFEVKRLEPYYQLSRPTGATASASLNMDYLTFLSYLIPLKAIRHRQWAVLYSSLATLGAGSLVPVLQSASVQMVPEKKDRKDGEPKYIRIEPQWSRAMTASLFAVAICGILLLFKLRRKSGLLSDPKGIAGIAAMATQSHILQDFQGLDVAPQRRIHEKLANRRYILHKSSLWQGEYIRTKQTDSEHDKAECPHPFMLTLKGGIPYIIGILAFGAALPVFLFQPNANVVTEKAPFLLTALATTVKLLWGTLDCDVRIIEPFYILSRRNAPPRTLTLDYTGTMPGWLPIKAALNRHWLVALVGFGAILTEVLTVCVSSFSVDGKKFISGEGHDINFKDHEDNSRGNTDETFKSFWVSFALACGILIYLCVVAGLVYAQRRHYFLPRQPGTIASVLAFIHQSNMLMTFVDTQRMNSTEMTKYLEGKTGKTYGLGWFRGRDREDHCGIDEEPIAAEYKHGVDWRKGRVSGLQAWDVY